MFKYIVLMAVIAAFIILCGLHFDNVNLYISGLILMGITIGVWFTGLMRANHDQIQTKRFTSGDTRMLRKYGD